jgi:AraC-like DNA-binding protein
LPCRQWPAEFPVLKLGLTLLRHVSSSHKSVISRLLICTTPHFTPLSKSPKYKVPLKVLSTPTRQKIILRSNNVSSDDFGALFSRLFGNRYADTPPIPSNIIIGGVYGRHEGVSFRRMHYHGDFTVSFPDPQDEITFVIPTAGKIVFKHVTESVGVAQVGLAIDKADIRSMHFLDNHAQHGISINRGQLTERLSALLGKPILQKIVFEPMVDLNVAGFQGIKALIDLATGTEFDLLIHAGTLMPSRLREMLVDAVLEAWPHNFTEALRRPAPLIAPRHVKLAVEYIQEHPDNLVSGADLARLSNVSQRALQEGFRRFVGTSIVTYQRQVRLERAYAALSQPGTQSVTEVALRFGFSNVGRFSQYFQTAYGVSPADFRSRRQA